MKRRQFIRNMAFGSAAGLSLGGIPVNLLGAHPSLKRMAAASTNDNVLVFIQMHGGNDGLNTLIPISQYTEYYNLRPNIAIKHTGTRSYIDVDQSVDDDARVGLHPDMLPFYEMYQEGKVAIIQNVGYPDMNLSHFRGRDVVFMGIDESGNYDYNSGWMGRYLDYEFPGYPDAYPSDEMPHPIGIELSGTLSLAFHRENGIPIGLNIGNPDQFHQLISSVGVDSPLAFPDSHAGDELRYIMEFEQKSNVYAEKLKEVWDNSTPSSIEYRHGYPYSSPGVANNLASQLELIARLIDGGVKTKIFLCRIGGFDTHGEQVDPNDHSLGLHAELLYKMSTAVQDFYSDLKARGIDDKVLSLTFTEFGRRAYSNESYGTDHGTATPVFVFGTKLNPGIKGKNPGLGEDDLHRGNLVYNIDYRQIYTSVVQDWFGASDEAMENTGFLEWVNTKIPIVTGTGVETVEHGKNPTFLHLYPNPAKDMIYLQYQLSFRGPVTMNLLDTGGRRIQTIQLEGKYGANTHTWNISDLEHGLYVIQMQYQGKSYYSKFMKM